MGEEGLANAIALNTAAMNLTRVLGPTLAGVMLAVSGATVVYFSSSNLRSAAYAADHQGAAGFAEAGMNFARSTLWQAADLTDPAAVPPTTVTVLMPE